MIQGVTIAASSGAYTNGTGPDRRTADNLVSNVGLYGDIHTPFAPSDMWWVYATNTPLAIPPAVGTNYVVFNLGGVYTVNALKVWNYNDNTTGPTPGPARGIKNGSISYSLDGVNFTTNIASQSFNEAPGTFSSFAQLITLPAPITAQYLRIDVATNWGATNGVGLSKVRFISNTNPPTILSASRNFGSNQVTVVFSETMDPASATNKANYSIAGTPTSPAISNVVMGAYADRVILTTSPLTNNSYSVSVSGVYDEQLTASVTNNSTLAVGSEVWLWLRSDLGVQTDGSGNVTQWNDQSGYSHNAVPAVWLPPTSPANGGIENTSPPILAGGVVNGAATFSSVQFTGNTNILGISPDLNNPLDGDLTIFLVEETTANTAGSYNFLLNKDGGYNLNTSNLWAGPFDFYIAHSGNKPNFLLGHGEGSATTVGTSAGINLSQFYLLTLSVSKGTNGVVYTNGLASSLSATFVTDPVRDFGSPMYLGYRPNLSTNGTGGYFTPINQGFTGYIPEVIVVHGTITPGDMVNINSYIRSKYGIPVAAPTIVEQPASLTIQAGKTATFWVNMTGSSGYAYQWYSNNVAIAGATAAVYTTPPLTSSANNASYTVAVTSGVTLNSNPATVAVVPDTTPPTIFSAAKSAGLTNIVVVYSESVSTTMVTNYTLNGGASVLSARFGSTSNQVILTTTALSADAIYTLSVTNVQDLFGNTMAGTTVPVMPSGMVLWLRADSGVVTNANSASPGEVDAWIDQTALGNNATAYANPGFRPALGLDSGVPPLSSPSLFFNNNYLTVAQSPSVALTGNMTVCAVYNMSDYNAYHSILGKTTGGQPNPYDLYTGNPANFQGKLRFGRGNGSSSTFVGSATVAPPGAPHFHSIVMNGSSVNYYVDGAADGSSTLTASTTDGGQPLIIGSRNALDIWMNGDLPELLIFSNALSSVELTNIDDYIGTKYFPLTVSQAPADYATNAGGTATFSVAATQGSAHLAYQWMENGTNIPGATSAFYTTGVLIPSDNGDTFAVAIGPPGFPSTISGPVVLTVSNLPPAIYSAGTPVWNTTNEIVIVFSEPVTPATANNAANYLLDNGATVLSAAVGSLPNEVVLATSPLTPGTGYNVTVQNLQNFYGATMQTPATASIGIYPPALALWLKAGTGVTTDPNGVTQWNDLSANGNNLAQPYGPPYEPQFATNGLGDLVVSFSATNETYMTANWSSSLAIAGDLTILAVVNFATLAGNTNGMIVSKTSAAQPAAYDYYVTSGSVVFDGVNGTRAPSTGVPHLLDVTLRGTTVTHRLDEQPNGGGTLSANFADMVQPLYLGTRADGVNRLTGDLAEMMIIGSAVSPGDLASIENYLATSHGVITVNASPTSIVASLSNHQLTLSWPADHTGWTLQAQTNNPSMGLGTNWVNVADSTLTNQVVVPVDSTSGSVFYRLFYSPN